jgi:Zn-dependent peptidase ImmA (M78 family)
MTDEELRKLYDTASGLAANAKRPVEIRAICDRLGIPVKRALAVNDRQTIKRAFLHQNGDTTEIVLPKTTADAVRLNRWEKFLIAHELGHYFLSKLRIPKPLGSREYWEVEKVCDTFARRLLLPTAEVVAVLSISQSSAVDLLAATVHLHLRFDVPWPVAAHEVSECARKVSFFKVIVDDQRFRVSASTLPNKRQTGRHIEFESSFGRLLRELPERHEKPQRIPTLDVALFEPLRDINDAAVYRSGREYRVATVVG